MAEEITKVSDTEIKITQTVERVVSLDFLKNDLKVIDKDIEEINEEMGVAITQTQEPYLARIQELESIKAQVQAKIDLAISLGVKNLGIK